MMLLNENGRFDVANRLFAEAANAGELFAQSAARVKTPEKQGRNAAALVDYGAASVADLVQRDHRVEFLIENVLAADQVAVIAGPFKSFKSMLALDACVSLATASKFLGTFSVPTAKKVLYMTGESAPFLLAENLRRVCAAHEVDPRALTNMIVATQLPQLNSGMHQDAVERLLDDNEIEVACFDPWYKMGSLEPSNSRVDGQLMASLASLCQMRGVSLLIVDHTLKGTAEKRTPLSLSDLAYSGAPQHYRQWALVNHAHPFDEDTGAGTLNLVAGGAAGHGGRWLVDIQEGQRDDPGGRVWQVDVHEGKRSRSENAQTSREAKILGVLRSLVRGTDAISEKMVRTRSGVNSTGTSVTLKSLEEQGRVKRSTKKHPRSGKEFTAWRL